MKIFVSDLHKNAAIAPNYNVAPGAPQPVIRRSHDTGERELMMKRWGIAPWFAKAEDEFKALSMINATGDIRTALSLDQKSCLLTRI
jgi:putative SOS response-associated peptidase YedK